MHLFHYGALGVTNLASSPCLSVCSFLCSLVFMMFQASSLYLSYPLSHPARYHSTTMTPHLRLRSLPCSKHPVPLLINITLFLLSPIFAHSSLVSVRPKLLPLNYVSSFNLHHSVPRRCLFWFSRHTLRRIGRTLRQPADIEALRALSREQWRQMERDTSAWDELPYPLTHISSCLPRIYLVLINLLTFNCLFTALMVFF